MVGAYLHLHECAREAVIVVHPSTEEERAVWQFDPVTIIMRVSDAGFDTIQRYDIPPRPTSAVSDPAPLNGSAHASTTLPPHMPCIFPSLPSLTLPVAPSCGSFIVGPSGKGLWLE